MTRFWMLLVCAVLLQGKGFSHESYDTCVQSICNEKIYLKPEAILPTPDGLFLQVNDETIVPLPQLNSDANGCYIECRCASWIGRDCPNCGQYYVGSCTNPDCPGKKKAKEHKEEKKRKLEEYRKKKKS